MTLQVLALEPFFGGSHRAFLEGWVRGSRHHWTVMGLGDRHWKWRMRGGAVTLAERVEERARRGEEWDVVVASSMLDLATFQGLSGAEVGRLPAVVYFHENQLTYPLREGVERDLHFAFTNLTSALAADEVWFNSAFHRDEWLAALPDWLRRMPEPRLEGVVERVAGRCRVEHPGIDWPEEREDRSPGPLRVVWAARWEFDKAPERLFAALERLDEAGIDFRVSVLGQGYRRVPEVFAWARERFAPQIERWGYAESRREYLRALAEADAVVSTADHEFFGLAVVEAVAAGAFPLLPRRLAYPEVLAEEDDFFYGGEDDAGEGEAVTEVEALARRLGELARRVEEGGLSRLWRGDPGRGRRVVRRFAWETRAARLDEGLERLAG